MIGEVDSACLCPYIFLATAHTLNLNGYETGNDILAFVGKGIFNSIDYPHYEHLFCIFMEFFVSDLFTSKRPLSMAPSGGNMS